MNIQMENKLTNEEISRVFAMYFNPKEKIFINPDTGIKYNGTLYQLNSMKGFLHEYKLILISLNKISDEHAIEVCKIGNINYSEENETAFYDLEGFRSCIEEILQNNYESWKCLQYLIQQSYAVPLFFGFNHWANGKTAIELEIAINKI